jgi:hypothetical protein
MHMRISKQSLIEQAKKFGRSERWVRQNADTRLIPKASAKGRGRGRGQDWSYPQETLVMIRWLHIIKKVFGYQGEALRFAIWWVWGGDPSEETRDYIVSMFTKIRLRIERAIIRELKANYSLNGMELVGDIEGNRISGLGDFLDRRMQELTDTLGIGDLISTNFPEIVIDIPALHQIVHVLTSTYVAINPEDVAVSALFLEDSIQRIKKTHPHQQVETLIMLLQILHRPEWLDELVTYIYTCPSEELDYLKGFIHENPLLQHLVKLVVNWEFRNQIVMSMWKLKRLGPWRRPATAYRAALTGWLLAIRKWADIDDLSKLFS